jgi:hypothetical protein
MSVDTGGIEALRNSAELIEGDSPAHTFIKTLDGWVFHAVGRKIEITYPSSTVEVYSFLQGGTLIYEVTVTWSNSTKDTLTSVERTG